MKKIKLFLKKFPRHWLIAASAWVSKIIVSLVQIISIRVLLNYLGEDKYAVYVIAYSLIGWFSLAEFSVGYSLQNFISEARVKKQSYEKYLIATLQIISVLFMVSIFLTVFISTSIQDIVFRKFIYIPGIQNINIVFLVGIITIATSLLSAVYRVYYALHKGYVLNIALAIAAIISMISIVILNRYSSAHQSILSALLIFTLPQLIIILIPFMKVFGNCCSKILDFNFTVLKSLLIRAIKFHGMIIMSMAYGQTDYLIMSQTLSSNEIVTYNIFLRAFMFFSFIYSALLAAFWPVSAEMYVNKKFEDIKKTIKKYLIYVTLFMIVGTISIIFFSGFITKLLAPGLSIIPTLYLLIFFGLYITIRAWQDTFVVFLQSINALKIFWLYLPFQFTVNIFTQYFLSKKYGTEGIVMGLIISIMFVSIWPLSLKTYRILSNKIT